MYRRADTFCHFVGHSLHYLFFYLGVKQLTSGADKK